VKWRQSVKADGDAINEKDGVLPTGPADGEQWAAFKAEVAPASPAEPMAVRAIWRRFLQSEEVRVVAGLNLDETFDIGVYNRLANTEYESLFDTPCPLPDDAPEPVAQIWRMFVETR